MSNTLLNISMITKESLRELKNQLAFTKGANSQYDDQFAKTGAKIGATINIRKPCRFSVTDGASLNIQNVTDQSVSLVLDQRKHVGFQFSQQELTLNIDEFSRRYIRPAVTALANQIDSSGLTLYQKVWNSVGNPGTAPATVATILSAQQKLDENGCPVDDSRSLVLSPAGQASMVGALTTLLNPAKEISEQYRKGRMGYALGADWAMDQNVASHTVGPLGGTPLMDTTGGAVVDGATTIITDAWTSGNAKRLSKGDVFTIASVYSVNPQSKVSTGSLMQFVVTADTNDVSGVCTIPFSPAIQSTGQYQNVDSLPADEAAILIFGAANTYHDKVSPANLLYHRDAFVLGMADLDLPGGVDMASRATDPESGLSIRLVRQYDINGDTMPCRLDVLYGWKAVYPELACRIQG